MLVHTRRQYFRVHLAHPRDGIARDVQQYVVGSNFHTPESISLGVIDEGQTVLPEPSVVDVLTADQCVGSRLQVGVLAPRGVAPLPIFVQDSPKTIGAHLVDLSWPCPSCSTT